MINSKASTPLLERAVLRHLSDVQGLRGIQAFVGSGGEWAEAARRGDVPAEAHRAILSSFDPEAGGSVEPLESGGGWLASYMIGGPGLDLVLILRLAQLSPSELQARLAAIEAKVGWLMVAALSDRRAAGESRAWGNEIGAQVLLDAARAPSLRVLADQWIARLEAAFNPGLVCVLWVNGGAPKLAALSGGGLIERPSDARSALEHLSETVIAHRAPMLISAPDTGTPPPEGLDPAQGTFDGATRSRREDEAMAVITRLGANRALLMTVYEAEEPAAVVAMLFAKDQGAGLRVEGGDVISAILGEAMTIQRRAHPRLARRFLSWAGDCGRAVFGRTVWKLKLALALVLAVIAISAFVPSNLRPSFTASIEARDRQIVSAPFDGFLAQADFQLGDRITDGALLVAMEDSDIRLRLAQSHAEEAEIASELQSARAKRDTAQVRLLEAQRIQSVTRIDLLERELDLAQFNADGPGIVVGGDAWRRVGDRVRLGEPLLELAAEDSFRVMAFVDEDWIADIAAGTTGSALLTAYPQRPVAVVLAAIGADPQMRDGANTFPVWFEFSQDMDLTILDGMRGIVRLDMGERSMLVAYSRGIVRWAERALWRLGIGAQTSA